MTDLDPLHRFSDRVDDYVKYRPTYPASLIAFLVSDLGLRPGVAVADVGSGTGVLTKLLLGAGARVHAVEPNAAMRRAAEGALAGYPGFTSVDGTGEATGLPDAAVALVTCAQAFHWLDPALARAELARILAPRGWVALVWNTAKTDDAFGAGYEAIKDAHGTDYARVRHEWKRSQSVFDDFFGAGRWQERVFANAQALDFEGLRGRMLSSSYAPQPGHPEHAPMLAALRRLFDTCARDGQVHMAYDTQLFYGRL